MKLPDLLSGGVTRAECSLRNAKRGRILYYDI